MGEHDARPLPFRWRSNVAWKDREHIVVRGYDVNALACSEGYGGPGERTVPPDFLRDRS
jgi:hypothetical protein